MKNETIEALHKELSLHISKRATDEYLSPVEFLTLLSLIVDTQAEAISSMLHVEKSMMIKTFQGSLNALLEVDKEFEQ